MNRHKVRSNITLKLPKNVTRRDFVGGTLLGVGTSLLTAGAPGLLRSAQSQSRLSYELVGADWTGPGGIGDYSSSNGNTHEVINAAHSLRDGHWASVPDLRRGHRRRIRPGGCRRGICGSDVGVPIPEGSGDDARVLLLDNHSVFGGEAKQNEVDVDGYRLQAPQGSNMCLWPARVMSDMGFFYHPVWEEVGLPMGDEPDAPTWLDTATGSDKDLSYPKEHYGPMMIYRDEADQGYFFEDPDDPEKLRMARNPWLSGYEEMNWPDEFKRELSHLDQFLIEDHPDDLNEWLDSMTYAEFLTNHVGVTRQDVFEFLSPMIASYGTGLGCRRGFCTCGKNTISRRVRQLPMKRQRRNHRRRHSIQSVSQAEIRESQGIWSRKCSLTRSRAMPHSVTYSTEESISTRSIDRRETLGFVLTRRWLTFATMERQIVQIECRYLI